jgi:hypothetical protein
MAADIQRGQTLSLDVLDPHSRDYRYHPDEHIQALKASLTRFGQVRSIAVQPKAAGRYTILAGHGVTYEGSQGLYKSLWRHFIHTLMRS